VDGIQKRWREQIRSSAPARIVSPYPYGSAARASAGLNVDFGITDHPGRRQINFMLERCSE